MFRDLSMLLISPNFDVKSIIFSQFWPGAFPQNCWKSPELIIPTFHLRLFVIT